MQTAPLELANPQSYPGFEWPVALQLAEALRHDDVRQSLGLGPLGFDVLAHVPCAGMKPLTLADAERVHDRFGRYSARQGKAEWRGTTADVVRALMLAARERPFHPVGDWLSGLAWDRKPRLRLLAQVLAVPEPQVPLATAMLQRWMMGAVTRAFQPGFPLPLLLTLVGQSEVADLFFQLLVPRAWYYDAPATPLIPVLRNPGHHPWICLRSDLDELLDAHAVELVALAQATTDTASGPFSAEGEHALRTTLLVGHAEQLPRIADPALRRCVWAVPLGPKPDPVGLEDWRDQLWAEIACAYRSEPLELSSSHEMERRALTCTLAEQDPLTDRILDAILDLEKEQERYGDPGRLTMDRILMRTRSDVSKQTMEFRHRIGAILRANGFEQRRVQVQNFRRTVWERTAGAAGKP